MAERQPSETAAASYFQEDCALSVRRGFVMINQQQYQRRVLS